MTHKLIAQVNTIFAVVGETDQSIDQLEARRLHTNASPH